MASRAKEIPRQKRSQGRRDPRARKMRWGGREQAGARTGIYMRGEQRHWY